LLIALGLFTVAVPSNAEPLAIGHASRTFFDPARNDRPVTVEIYYPADVPGEEVPVGGEPGARYAPLVFGHGYLMAWSTYENIWTALTPAGFIVAFANTETGLLPDHLELALDLSFLVATLRSEGQSSSSLFYERVAERAAVMGHSMGGGASVLAAALDPSIDAVANLAAAETNPSAIAAAADVAAPALIVSAGHDCVTPPEQHQLPIYQALDSACRTWITIAGGSHCQFAQYNLACSLGEVGCTPPSIARSEQHAITTELLLPWLAYFMYDDLGAWGEFEALLAAGAGISSVHDCEITGIAGGAPPAAAASAITLAPARPTPFSATTAIDFELPVATQVRLEIWSATGRHVQVLHDGLAPPGPHRIVWDGRDARGRRLASGVYFCRLQADGRQLTRRLLFIR
jgi:pimeloyl-ACP methyl ester carboxylesterase